MPVEAPDEDKGTEWNIPPVTVADWMPVEAPDEDNTEPIQLTAAEKQRSEET
eukprot:CAMPEP_0119051262 /NCGR_PEP_ID=MMETSP1177-20130426/72934_1 /TAXON_ID=2985 /ORGANISM="Ochromonas sp, Strain CCMP1899" /LENGTH=51 /DNA_ID=CAMNT_0007030403 /DNA_START=1963 /DNA_END=2118 /DNA_ORIENTATION=+